MIFFINIDDKLWIILSSYFLQKENHTQTLTLKQTMPWMHSVHLTDPNLSLQIYATAKPKLDLSPSESNMLRPPSSSAVIKMFFNITTSCFLLVGFSTKSFVLLWMERGNKVKNQKVYRRPSALVSLSKLQQRFTIVVKVGKGKECEVSGTNSDCR